MNVEDYWAATEERLDRDAGSLGELLERLGSRLSPVLLGDPEWRVLLARAHTLPASIAAFPFGFELPLHEPRPIAGFGASVTGGTRTAAFFEQRRGVADARPLETRIARLIAATEPENAPLRRVAGRKMLLEYDCEAMGRGAERDPGVFLFPDESLLTDPRSAGWSEDLGTLVDGVALATGREWEFDHCRQLEHTAGAMRSDSTIRALGAFPDGDGALKLTMVGFRTAGGVAEFLERVGLPGQVEPVSSILSRYEQRGAFAYLGVHLDIHADGVAPNLALSVYAEEGQWLKDMGHWTPLLEGIRADDVAVPEKLAALSESWCGAQTLFSGGGPLLLLRGIHHVEFVLTGDSIAEVKAYLFLLTLGGLAT